MKTPTIYSRRLRDLEKFKDLLHYISYRIWKNSEPTLPVEVLQHKKIRGFLFIQALRFGKFREKPGGKHETRSLYFSLANKS